MEPPAQFLIDVRQTSPVEVRFEEVEEMPMAPFADRVEVCRKGEPMQYLIRRMRLERDARRPVRQGKRQRMRRIDIHKPFEFSPLDRPFESIRPWFDHLLE